MNPEKDTSGPRAARRGLAAAYPMSMRLAPLLIAICMLGSGPAAAQAPAGPAAEGSASAISEAEVDRQAEAISRSIMSPFCPGRTVSACPNAGPWRNDIREWVAEGVPAVEIRERLAARVPEHNLSGVPKNRLGWLLPVGAGIGALGFLVFLLRYLIGPRAGVAGGEAATRSDSKSAAPDAPAASAPPKSKSAAPASRSSEDWDARLDEELETLER